mmetsp:Transcript_77388/g.169367  ORF Transcript_77388/g.169367 Transcript_77388/m.169367 type:complete len:88 (+) Transcript_77388:478-741(+)
MPRSCNTGDGLRPSTALYCPLKKICRPAENQEWTLRKHSSQVQNPKTPCSCCVHSSFRICRKTLLSTMEKQPWSLGSHNKVAVSGPP